MISLDLTNEEAEALIELLRVCQVSCVNGIVL